MIAETIDPATVPGIVRARIVRAHELQRTRRQIARGLGLWYVADERRGIAGSQAARDAAAAAARDWRAAAIEHGHNPAAVRRAVLAGAGLSHGTTPGGCWRIVHEWTAESEGYALPMALPVHDCDDERSARAALAAHAVNLRPGDSLFLRDPAGDILARRR